MNKEYTASGATIEEAQENALRELGLTEEDNVMFEVIDVPVKKTLGLFGGSPARVRAYTEEDEPTPAPAKSPAKKFEKADKKANNDVLKSEKKVEKSERTEKIERAEKSERPERKEKKKSDEKRVIVNAEGKTDAAIAYLRELTDKMGKSGIEFTPNQREDSVEIMMEGEGLGLIIGRRGETLDSLQYLTSLVANKGHEGDFFRITLNTGDYRQKREETLESVAKRSVSQARRTGRNQTLEPMNSYERRVIHTVVQDIDGFTSWSVGSGDNRRVIIGTEKGAGGDSFSGGRDRAPRDRAPRNDRPVRDRGFNSPAPEKAADAPAHEPKVDSDVPLYGRIDVK